MPEPVRLVIWDLDDTFWKGTLTEGGITAYSTANQTLVIEFAKRGIMSSICSKNDLATVRPILEEKGVWEYFVFPSLSWAPKGPRVAAIVEAAQLRPANVLLVDDNPHNLAEAKALLPDLQAAGEKAISGFLRSPLFKGKVDKSLSRLKQYKLLEQKAQAAVAHEGDNEEFLRGCNIRVQIDYNVEGNIDRAIELINRTHQLNYTKLRLPEAAEAARAELLNRLSHFGVQAGLVRVVDNYGDYGFVGFFLTVATRKTLTPGAAHSRLIHYCFSCRTLGMSVERWVYDYLGRPELEITGGVLTDLSASRAVDWIRLADGADQSAIVTPRLGGPAVVFGGCEAQILSLYFKRDVSEMKVFGNYVSDGVVCLVNRAEALLDLCDRDPVLYKAEAEALGLPMDQCCDDVLGPAAQGTTYFVNLSMDAAPNRSLRHKQNGWNIFLRADQVKGFAFGETSRADLAALLEGQEPALAARILALADHLEANYEQAEAPTLAQRMNVTRELIERVPQGGRIVFAVNHDFLDPDDPRPFNTAAAHESFAEYVRALRDLVKDYPYAAVVSFAQALTGPEDIVVNHYARAVFMRMADLLIEQAIKLRPRHDPAEPKDIIRQRIRWASQKPSPLDLPADAETMEALFRLILGRAVGNEAYKAENDGKFDVRFWVHALINSGEFKHRFQQRHGLEAPPV